MVEERETVSVEREATAKVLVQVKRVVTAPKYCQNKSAKGNHVPLKSLQVVIPSKNYIR